MNKLWTVALHCLVLAVVATGCAVPADEPSDEEAPKAEAPRRNKPSQSDAPPPETSDAPPLTPATPPVTPPTSTPPPATPSPTTPTTPTAPALPPPVFTIRSGGMCLDVSNDNHADGVQLITYPCNGQSNQRFSFGDKASLRSSAGKCLDVPGGVALDGTALILWPCNGADNQRFERSGGQLRVLGNCVASRDGKVVVAACSDAAAVLWTLE